MIPFFGRKSLLKKKKHHALSMVKKNLSKCSQKIPRRAGLAISIKSCSSLHFFQTEPRCMSLKEFLGLSVLKSSPVGCMVHLWTPRWTKNKNKPSTTLPIKKCQSCFLLPGIKTGNLCPYVKSSYDEKL